MREFLFRGKRIDNGERLYGNLLRTDDGTYIIQNYIPQNELSNYSVDPATVSQYTGLNDKNGRKIFEWDRVRVSNGNPFEQTVATVVFSDGCFDCLFDKSYGRDYLKCCTCNHDCEVLT